MSTSILGKVTIVPKGAYSASTTYNRLDLVTYNGSSFVARVDNLTGVTPVDGANWQLLAAAGEGATITGETHEYVQQAAADYSGTPPTSGWTETVPTVSSGNYLWQRTITEYSDGNSYTSYIVARFGTNGTGSVSTVNEVEPVDGNVQLVISDIATVDSSPTSGSTNLVTSGGVNQFVYAIQSQLQTAINGKVPTTRKVNNKELSGDITLSASDVGAATLDISTSLTIPAASWVQAGEYYQQSINVTGLQASDAVFVDADLSRGAGGPTGKRSILANLYKIYRAIANAGQITFYADELPDTDIPIQIVYLR